MMKNNLLFHVISMVWHAVRAWNTGGEGIHSPRLFYMVRHLFGDTARLYAWEAIEQQRQAMLRAPKLIHVVDYGTGKNRNESVMHIARTSLMPSKQVQLLARLLNYMSGTEYAPNRHRPLHIVELGTSLGITTAYLASVDSKNTICSFEGSDEIADVAQMNWEKLKLKNIHLVRGNMDDTLYNYARESNSPVDFVLIDANHTEDATLRYFNCLINRISPDGVVVLDDIRYSPAMYRAWQQITKHPQVTATMDLGNFGLVFFYKNLQQKTYLLRV